MHQLEVVLIPKPELLAHVWILMDQRLNLLRPEDDFVFRKIDQLQSENDFLPWAKTVLRFEALKTRRKFARDKHVFNDELIEVLAHEELEDETPFASMQEALSGCLDKMSPPNRELVMAPYDADGTVTEIAEKSGRTVNSLYKLLGRIRLKLRQCIEGAIPDQARGVVS